MPENSPPFSGGARNGVSGGTKIRLNPVCAVVLCRALLFSCVSFFLVRRSRSPLSFLSRPFLGWLPLRAFPPLRSLNHLFSTTDHNPPSSTPARARTVPAATGSTARRPAASSHPPFSPSNPQSPPINPPPLLVPLLHVQYRILCQAATGRAKYISNEFRPATTHPILHPPPAPIPNHPLTTTTNCSRQIVGNPFFYFEKTSQRRISKARRPFIPTLKHLRSVRV